MNQARGIGWKWKKIIYKNILGATRGQDQLVAGQCWCKVPFEDILQNTVSCFFLAKSRSRKQFGTINKLYSRHFTSNNIREGHKKWRSCIQNKSWDFEKQKEDKKKPFRSLSTPLLVLTYPFSFWRSVSKADLLS